MKAFEAAPGMKLLFCFTHPDDELGILAWLRRCVKSSAEVHLSWTHRTEVREREARAIAAELGVPADRITFHAGMDGRVADQMPELLPGFRDLMARVKPDRVVCPAFEQGHIDHDATHFMARQSFEGPMFEYPMYHPYTRRIQTLGRFADPAGQEMMDLTREESAFKNAMSKRYPSQNIRSVVFWYTVYRMLCLKPAGLRSTERMRIVGAVDYTVPNLPEPWRSEVADSEQWHRWQAALRAVSETVYP